MPPTLKKLKGQIGLGLFVCLSICLSPPCFPILITTFPEWLSSIEPLPTHTRRRASVLVVCVIFCMHMHNFACLIRQTPPPTFSDTAITDRHSDTSIFQLRAHWVQISWSIGLEESFGHVPWWESNPRLPACKVSTLSTRPGSPKVCLNFFSF